MIKIRLICISIFIVAVNNFCYAQHKRSMHWYFGYKAGLDFTSGVPVADTTSKLISIEGSATISDTSGNLLFYSSGEFVWNREHNIMPNGYLIMGDQSAVQSSLIAPTPGSDSLYYLFTVSQWNGFRYHIIDMSLDSGRGDLIQRDILLGQATEELAGTMHCNYRDYWILMREPATDAFVFKAYRLAPDGLHNPVVSAFSFPNFISNRVGCLTFSQDGSKLVFSSFYSDIFLFDFDKQTGVLTLNNTILRHDNQLTYATALSSDNQKLYVSYWVSPGSCNLVQYDLTRADINASEIILDTVSYRNGSPNGYGFIGQLRLAPDQKIYISRWSQEHPFLIDPETYYSLDSLDVINDPNATGLSCNFQRNAVYLQKKVTTIGLPNFISHFTTPVINRSDSCEDVTVPVVLSNIWVVMQQDKAIVKWETLEELNAAYFIVERSTDGIHFSRMGTVNATGTSGTIHTYSFTDALPAGTIFYYRIQMVDTDGRMRTSKIVVLNIAGSNKLQVFPNPFSDNINIRLNEPGANAVVEVSDAAGKCIMNKKCTVAANGIIHLTLANLPKGLYFLKVVLNGTVSTVKLLR